MINSIIIINQKPDPIITNVPRLALPLFLVLLILSLIGGCDWGSQVVGTGLSDDDWITVNKDYFSQRYVDLDQITPSNVKDLRQVCEVELNEPSWFSSGILKIGRTLYFTSRRMTFAIDAVTCEKRWRYVNDEEPFPTNANNRGLAYLPRENGHPDMLFRGTTNGHLLALDPKTGAVIWDNTTAANPLALESIIAAPVAADGKVYVGIATADLGVCGRVMAFDAYTGNELWRFHTVPIIQNGKTDCEWQGGAQWTSLSLDPTTHELFVPVSNPYPDYVGIERPGTNLLTNSVIALDTTTTSAEGKLNWYYQAVPHDVHDWDLGTTPVLYRTAGGKEMLVIAGKDGFVYGVDRKTHELVYKTAGTTQVNVNAPFPVNYDFPPTTDSLRVCPGTLGGAQFTGPSRDPNRHALYVGMNDFCWFYFFYGGASTADRNAGQLVSTIIGDPDESAGENDGETETMTGATQADFSLGTPPVGYITAFDEESGEKLWTFKAPAQVQAGTVATKSGIVFAADTLGNLYALDATSGKELHRIDTRGAINSGLISYAVDGMQYVAAEVGGLSLNPPGITHPLRPESTLRVKIFALTDQEPLAKVTSWNRVPILKDATPEKAGELLYKVICSACHGQGGNGSAYPSLITQYHILTDAMRLKEFFATVPPPMPKLYPGMLSDDDVRLLVAYFKTLPITPQPGYTQPTSMGTNAWPAIYSVLTHPRCMNCHTSTDYPRQTNERHPHFYGVVRGTTESNDSTHTIPPNTGSAIARCSSCHGDSNNSFTGAPGAKPPEGQIGWHLAPLSDGWESAPNIAMDGPTLCEKIKNYAGSNDLLAHLDTFLVKWAFEPGDNVYGVPRTKPPLTFPEFIEVVQLWQKGGMPCPQP